jgi:hypothetical protein
MDDEALRQYPEWIVPHADYGDPECCGLILPKLNGGAASLMCSECGAVIKTVAAADVHLAMETCPLAKFAAISARIVRA